LRGRDCHATRSSYDRASIEIGVFIAPSKQDMLEAVANGEDVGAVFSLPSSPAEEVLAHIDRHQGS